MLASIAVLAGAGESMIDESLKPGPLLEAYRRGFFPMASPWSGEILWYSPDPRAIFPLDVFHVPRSLRKVLSRGDFEVRINSSFGEVIRSCAARAETWISAEIIQAYAELHRLGFAHSVESWKGKGLAGGLYGVAIGGAFFGESMFTRASNGSSVALIHLVSHLRERGFILFDTQILNPHIARFGAIEIPRRDYLSLLQRAVDKPVRFLM
jgi:leucyl/phenylalanyl-tRNA--protein transferase